MIISAAELKTKGLKTSTGTRLPANRGFIDDITITTTTHVQARWVLNALDESVSWARIKIKPQKSGSLIMKKGKVTKKFALKIQNEEIPSIMDKPVKCLGKWFDSSLKDQVNINQLEGRVTEGLKNIDETELPEKFNA